MYFSNVDEAQQWSAQFQSRRGASKPQDRTLPRTLAEKLKLTKRLIVAYHSAEPELAAKGLAIFGLFFENKEDGLKHLELVCWRAMELLIKRHSGGPLSASYGAIGKRGKGDANFNTFAERFAELVKAISTTRNLRKRIIEVPFLKRTIDDPCGEKETIQINKALNDKRARELSQFRASKEPEEFAGWRGSQTDAGLSDSKRRRTTKAKDIDSGDEDLDMQMTALRPMSTAKTPPSRRISKASAPPARQMQVNSSTFTAPPMYGLTPSGAASAGAMMHSGTFEIPRAPMKSGYLFASLTPNDTPSPTVSNDFPSSRSSSSMYLPDIAGKNTVYPERNRLDFAPSSHDPMSYSDPFDFFDVQPDYLNSSIQDAANDDLFPNFSFEH